MKTVMPIHRYKAFEPVNLNDRTWPNNQINHAPIWCSVDLRDGNQSLIEPMGLERKERMFKMLCKIGYKEIEVGFPSASQTDYDFVRHIIEKNLIPDGVVIQVLTQARPELIKRTFASLVGVREAIVHVYNSTSTTQRRVVFKDSREAIKQIALNGAQWLKEEADKYPDIKWNFQYSPESFTQTELEYAAEVSNAVIDIWHPTPEHKVIINLPATVEVAPPNQYADQIEWMSRNLSHRESVILSLHPHNDRGTAVAATELALMAGADRVEGTLFGNGERTGNVDLITLGMNLVSQGVDAGIDFSNLRELVATAEYCNQLAVPERHPYAGALVFTAFSGSHQDAINKGLAAMKEANSENWDVPYLPIDPNDVGASYEAVIRINSQSGKGGISYIMEQDYGFHFPRRLQIEFSKSVQQIADQTGEEITSDALWQEFQKQYFFDNGCYQLVDYQTLPDSHNSGIRILEADMVIDGKPQKISGKGSGPIEGFVNAMNDLLAGQKKPKLKLIDYYEHALQSEASAEAISYIEMQEDGAKGSFFGIGRHRNSTEASLNALICAYNRAL